jgi:YHS domain-containing protein/thiol-disulfide isomerase/thioredoxin
MMILRRTRQRSAISALSVVAVISCASMSLPSARATEPVPISWRDDYGGALEEAKSSNRLLWIQFTGPWCPNCVRMERDSFPDADVIDHAQRSFVPLKLRSDVHERLALGFDVSGLPATVLVTPTREVIAIRQGYLGPDELERVLSEGLATWRDREASVKNDTAKSDTMKPATAPQDGSTSPRTKEEPNLALSGYCPVSLVSDRRLVAGLGEHTIAHDGRIYRFANAERCEQFRKDPDRFIPVNRGDCPVTQVDRGAPQPGSPRWGLLYQGRLFVFANEESRRQFLSDPDRYALVDVAAQGFCAHCLAETGLLVRGDPSYAISRDGLRYWFPDRTHRAAFLAAKPPATNNEPVTTTARR